MKNDKLVKIGNESVLVGQIKHHKLDFQKDYPTTSEESAQRLEIISKVKSAWENLDATIFSNILSSDAFQYGSYWVSETMYGKQTYLNYIREKFRTIQRTNVVPIIAVVSLREAIAPQEYTIALHFTQGANETLLTFSFNKAEITAMYMTDPDIYTYEPLYYTKRTAEGGDEYVFLTPSGEPDNMFGNDEPTDLPCTVKPLTAKDRFVEEACHAFSGQNWDKPIDVAGKHYIWLCANEYAESWLPRNGYKILASFVQTDCLAYVCETPHDIYTVYLYAYGKDKTTEVSIETCNNLLLTPIVEESIPLVLYVNVHRYMDGDVAKYKIRNYRKEDVAPELWLVTSIGNDTILEYYMSKELRLQNKNLVWAFNTDSLDFYDCIISDELPEVTDNVFGFKISSFETFYEFLKDIHEKYGEMKLGYIRYNESIYIEVPYIDGFGYVGMSLNDQNKINKISFFPLTLSVEFIKADIKESSASVSLPPRLMSVQIMPPNSVEKYAAKLFFANGECRKGAFQASFLKDLALAAHLTIEELWKTIHVVETVKSKYKNYPLCGPALAFKNGFTIAGTRCYFDSTPYSEPTLVNEIVGTTERCRIRKIWTWDVVDIYEDEETNILRVLLSGDTFNTNGKYTFASLEGTRLTSLTFDNINPFEEGLSRVMIWNVGYGFINDKMNIVIPLQYDVAQDFEKGAARVQKDGRIYFIGKEGREIHPLKAASNPSEQTYQEIGGFSEGMCKVSILKLRQFDLAYHSDHDSDAGIWGYINEDGIEVVSPQYIYAKDFENGRAIVAKGKWTKDPKWNNKYNQGRYWTEEELWGAIDATGKEVIPCVFDEIYPLYDANSSWGAKPIPNLFAAQKNGKWGIIDDMGEWIAEPTFGKLDYDCDHGLIVFYNDDPWNNSDPDSEPQGLYDINQKKVLFEPQFLDITILDDGDFCVEVFDEKLGRKIAKIIDKTGNERFPSVYSDIITWRGEPYTVAISKGRETKRGLIDRLGNVVLPCVHNTEYDGFHPKTRRIVFVENKKKGLKDFNGNIIIPALYDDLCYEDENEFVIVIEGKESNKKRYGLMTAKGMEILPPTYERISWCEDQRHFLCGKGGHWEMFAVERLSAVL